VEIKMMKLSDIKPALYNPRKNLKPDDPEYKKLKRSMEEFDCVEPLIWNKRSRQLVGGHQRLKILKEKGVKEFEVSVVDLDEKGERALNVALNKIQGDWDFTKLADLMVELDDGEFDLELTGFDLSEREEIANWVPDDEEIIHKKLIDQFIVPPFSVLDTRQGYWQDRKRMWKDLIEDRGESRKEVLSELTPLRRYNPSLHNLGTASILDPVLSEVVLRWFNMEKGTAFDPFAGDTVFGFVSGYLGYKFKGIELRKEQCEINQARCDAYKLPVEYFCDDGQKVLDYIKPKSQDMLFSCPPFYDLEVYSDLPNDASNQDTYKDFLVIIETALGNSIKGLKDNRFAVIVCQDIRDKKGFYRGFPNHIRDIFEKKGIKLYNWIILINSIGSGAVRAANYMRNRKVVSVHQDILVFYKGNPRAIKNELNTDKAICTDG